MRGFSHGLEELAVKVPRQVFEELSGATAPTEPLVLDFARGDVQARTLARLVGRAVRADAAVPVDESTVLDLLGGFVSGRAADLATAHLAAAKTYIEEWLADPELSASQVACGIGISERHLSRVFATGGMSMPRYILNRRLDRAHRLLTEGPQLGVAEVAYRCGFSSPARFSHAFKALWSTGDRSPPSSAGSPDLLSRGRPALARAATTSVSATSAVNAGAGCAAAHTLTPHPHRRIDER
jgi:AraC-like DNA-binding protein